MAPNRRAHKMLSVDLLRDRVRLVHSNLQSCISRYLSGIPGACILATCRTSLHTLAGFHGERKNTGTVKRKWKCVMQSNPRLLSIPAQLLECSCLLSDAEDAEGTQEQN